MFNPLPRTQLAGVTFNKKPYPQKGAGFPKGVNGEKRNELSVGDCSTNFPLTIYIIFW